METHLKTQFGCIIEMEMVAIWGKQSAYSSEREGGRGKEISVSPLSVRHHLTLVCTSHLSSLPSQLICLFGFPKLYEFPGKIEHLVFGILKF